MSGSDSWGNAPSEKEERKGQRKPRHLERAVPDAMKIGTAGAESFAGWQEGSSSRSGLRSRCRAGTGRQ